MSFIDIIKNLFNNNKKNAKLSTTELVKTYGSSDQLQIYLSDMDGKALPNKKIQVKINGVVYEKTTNADGIAKQNIKLGCGRYTALISFEDDEYRKTTTYSEITVVPKIITQNLTMQEKDGSQFVAILTSETGIRLEGLDVEFTINGVTYKKTTGVNGEAKINIKLNKGKYMIETICLGESVSNTIDIKEKPKMTTRMEGTNINKAKSDTTQYQCAVYDDEGRVSGEVDITINGVTYTKKSNSEGLYKMNIKLEPGSYKLVASYKGDDKHLGSQVVNTIVVVEDPKKTVYNPISYLRQPNNVTCCPTCLSMASQIIGKQKSISQFSSACSTGSDGTSPANMISGAKKLGFKVSEIQRNKDGVKKAIDSGKPVIMHIMTYGLSCAGWSSKSSYGHYILCYNYSGDYYKIADPMHGLFTCLSTSVDKARYSLNLKTYRDIKYYSIELI